MRIERRSRGIGKKKRLTTDSSAKKKREVTKRGVCLFTPWTRAPGKVFPRKLVQKKGGPCRADQDTKASLESQDPEQGGKLTQGRVIRKGFNRPHHVVSCRGTK